MPHSSGASQDTRLRPDQDQHRLRRLFHSPWDQETAAAGTTVIVAANGPHRGIVHGAAPPGAQTREETRMGFRLIHDGPHNSGWMQLRQSSNPASWPG